MNFALILFVLTVFTGVLYAADKLVFRPQRKAKAARLVADFDARNRAALERHEPIVEQERKSLEDGTVRQPAWLEYTASFFPVILVVFLLRSFLFEPFRIPSGSMVPTLEIGDLILVNKYEYGIRLPVINQKVVELGQPKRGDVMVFRYPLNASQDYIKRVVGLPGDRIEYVNKQLTINGQAVPLEKIEPYYDPERLRSYPQFVERLGETPHRLIVDDLVSPGMGREAPGNTHPGACQYSGSGVVCQVPPGHYFMMGDNRDNSEDSRFWGFVPDENIVGRAFFIWMNFGNMGRIGGFR
ncbi:MAG TPA: signal peptidase I [Burkholderiaceae bacterium]|nr:signal peptidase I [Burkholderiaceae bacterium]